MLLARPPLTADGGNLDKCLVQDRVWSRNRVAEIKQRLSTDQRCARGRAKKMHHFFAHGVVCLLTAGGLIRVRQCVPIALYRSVVFGQDSCPFSESGWRPYSRNGGMETSLISINNLQLWPNCTTLPWMSNISCHRLQLSNVPQEESLCPCAYAWDDESHGAKGKNSFEIPIHMMVLS